LECAGFTPKNKKKEMQQKIKSARGGKQGETRRDGKQERKRNREICCSADELQLLVRLRAILSALLPFIFFFSF